MHKKQNQIPPPPPPITSYEEFFDKIKKGNDSTSYRSTFVITDIVKELAKNGWFQVDEMQMPVRERSPQEQTNNSGGYFINKGKQRRAIVGYQRPQSFITLDHDVTDLWFTCSKVAILNFEDHLHYQMMTFVQQETLEEDNLTSLPLIVP